MGGFVGGLIVGTIVVLALGAALSLTAPLTKVPKVAVSAPEPPAVEVPETIQETTDVGTDADLVELPPTVPETSGEMSDTLAELADVETLPDSLPEVQNSTDQVDAPNVTESAEVAVSTEAPAALQATPLVQGTPEAETLPEVVIDVPQAPEVPTEEIAEAEEPEPEVDVASITKPEPQENPFEDSPIAVEGNEDTAPRNLPRIASVPQIGGAEEAPAGLTIGTRVVPLTERDDAVEADNSQSVPVIPGKPIEAYAASFKNPEAKPLMSIILIDDEGAFGAEALQDFPYPLSFAVSPSDPEAAKKMTRHREAGFEVLALADLPEAASAQDAEVSMAVWLETLPETVGILEGVGSGIQGNRKLADQVAAIAGDTGRGLITQDNGLNTVQKLAARNGVPSGVIFRDIDGARQDPKIMRRFLDQAAFRAGQEGTVVMLGRLRPDTISALLLWGLEDRGGRVAMAPISAVMMKEVQ
nr:divergent polysaccharide deacetylase family protein [Ruegeria lacuscaerulensis]